MFLSCNSAWPRAFLATGLLVTTLQLHAAPTLDSRFSPEGSAQQIVLSTLQGARESIRLMGYTFTSPEIARELTAARQRNVNVKVVLDAEGNRGKASQAAMNMLVSAGIPLRTVSTYRIMHDKVIIVDDRTVTVGPSSANIHFCTPLLKNAPAPASGRDRAAFNNGCCN